MKRFWVSWRINANAKTNPKHDPPGPAILGYWVTGFDNRARATLCGVVESADEATARAWVVHEWPGLHWRFLNERAADWMPDARRFPPEQARKTA